MSTAQDTEQVDALSLRQTRLTAPSAYLALLTTIVLHQPCGVVFPIMTAEKSIL